MKVPVLNRNGDATGREIELPEDVFGIEPNEHVLWLAAKVYQSNMRQGTHAHKNRNEVRGGGRKPFKQKGTGRARQGTSRSPIMRGGGTIFGPEPHSYRLALPLKVRRLAKKSALSAKAKDARVMVVEDFTLTAPKTKDIVNFLDKVLPPKIEKGQPVKTALFLTNTNDSVLVKSALNVPRLQIEQAIVASAFDILRSRYIILQESAVAPLAEVLNRV
ncbi:MAG: 50S ribosomal protein L4 [bacterium]|nr:50S ribosomal protein L4 [bacterium]